MTGRMAIRTAVAGVLAGLVMAGSAGPSRAQDDGPRPIRPLGPPIRVPPNIDIEQIEGVQPGPGTARLAEQSERQKVTDAVMRGEVVFIGKLSKAIAGPVAMSEPPQASFTLAFEDVQALRGAKPADAAAFAYTYVRGRNTEPQVGQRFIVVATAPPAAARQPLPRVPVPPMPPERFVPDDGAAGAGTPGGPRFVVAGAAEGAGGPDEAGPSRAGATEGAVQPPPPVRPGRPQVRPLPGRPALLAGPGVTLTVEQVIPEKVEKFKNPYGNGQFTVTVANTTDKPVDVPALLTDGKTVFWPDCLLVLEGDQPHLLPGAGSLRADVRPVRLEPGKSVSTVVDTLKLEGIGWPRGGSRVHFRFALGELSAENFFYYYSSFHDPMRKDVKAELGPRNAEPIRPNPGLDLNVVPR